MAERKIEAMFDEWHIEDQLVAAESAAKALRDKTEADEKFRGLADAIRSLAVEVAKGAKTKGVKAEDVLNLAKATDLAQRIRARAKG